VTSALARALSLSSLGDRRHRAEIDASWVQGRGVYGGLVAGVLARALEAEAERGLALARLTTAFCAPLAPGAAIAAVDVVRAGRNVATLRASLSNRDALGPAATCLATFARPRGPGAFTHRGLVRPSVPAPDDVPDGPRGVYFPHFAKAFGFPHVLGPGPFFGGPGAARRGWGRPPETQPTDAALVCAVLDAWPPAIVARSSGWCPVASLELTIHFLATWHEPTVAPGGGWLHYDASCDHLEGGLADERAVLFDATGTPLATAQQLIAILPPAERPT